MCRNKLGEDGTPHYLRIASFSFVIWALKTVNVAHVPQRTDRKPARLTSSHVFNPVNNDWIANLANTT